MRLDDRESIVAVDQSIPRPLCEFRPFGRRIASRDVGLLACDEEFSRRAGAADRFDLVFDRVAEEADQEVGKLSRVTPLEGLRRGPAHLGRFGESGQHRQGSRGSGGVDLPEDSDGDRLSRGVANSEQTPEYRHGAGSLISARAVSASARRFSVLLSSPSRHFSSKGFQCRSAFFWRSASAFSSASWMSVTQPLALLLEPETFPGGVAFGGTLDHGREVGDSLVSSSRARRTRVPGSTARQGRRWFWLCGRGIPRAGRRSTPSCGSPRGLPSAVILDQSHGPRGRECLGLETTAIARCLSRSA